MKFIQRYRFKEIDNGRFDLSADYMGSAEFEAGCVGDARDLLCKTQSRLHYVSGLTLKDMSRGKTIDMPMALVTLDHTFTNGVSYASLAITDAIASVKNTSQSFKDNPKFDRLRRDMGLDKPWLPNAWLNVGYCLYHPQKSEQTTQAYRQQHIDYVENKSLFDIDPIWFLIPQPDSNVLLKIFGGHEVLRPDTVDISKLRMFDPIKFLNANGELVNGVVSGILTKGIMVKCNSDKETVRLHERQIVEILPYAGKQ